MNRRINKKLLILLLVFHVTFQAIADEGMWLVSLLNEINFKKIQEKGLKLNLEELYSTKNLSLKDAIVAIDGGSCTGSIVSSKGLMITNHHCGYSEIQNHSSLEHDYLKEGFWANSLNEELPNPGKTVSFLVDVKDVTEEVEKIKNENTDKGTKPNIRKIYRQITREAVKGTHYNADVRSMFGGNSYYLFIYETYKDVRLVGAPPSSIGNFGGETDNWEWPRHTADFTLFRVYTAPDGKPAEYSPENIPLKPKKFLSIDVTGVDKDDFAFIMGYPGRTKRYMTSFGVEEIINIINPVIIEMRGKKLETLRQSMKENDDIRIKYASKFSKASNYWKYSIGQSQCLKKYNTIQDKQELEKHFQDWANSNTELQAKYGSVMSSIAEAYKNKASVTHAIQHYNEAVLMGPEIIKFSMRMKRLKKMAELNKLNEKNIQKNIDILLSTYQNLFKDYDKDVDKQLFENLLQHFADNIEKKYLPQEFTDVAEKYNWNISKLADNIYANSIFTDYAKIENFLNDLTINSEVFDLAMNVTYPLMEKAMSLNKDKRKYEQIISAGNKLFIEGLLEMNPEKDYYPDANATMRFTYGTVDGYEASDAIRYNYYTTIDGVIEKYNSGKPEYEIPEKLKSLYESKDFGNYESEGTIRTCFLTDHDITGGNSGSPVLNAYGELIGLAFDGNWEAMSSDIDFIPEKQKCINADIRYVLYVIDKLANCQYIMNELSITKK